jgi:hypothetical protein
MKFFNLNLSSFLCAMFACVITLAFATCSIADGHDPLLKFKSELAVKTFLHNSGLGSAADVRASMPIASWVVTNEGVVDYVEATFLHRQLGEIRLFMRGPKDFWRRTDHSLRAIFLASGFSTGKSAVRLLGHDSQSVAIGFIYPTTIEDLKRDLWRTPTLTLDFLRRTPLQIAASLQWLSQLEWLRAKDLNAVGVSLGGIFLPVSLRITNSLGTFVDGSVLAFTGAHLSPILEYQLKNHLPRATLEKVLHLVNNLTALIDPKLHLPFLNGRFLTVRADQDQIFPLESSLILEGLLPQPKTISVVHGPHIAVDQPALIAATQAVIFRWLADQPK